MTFAQTAYDAAQVQTPRDRLGAYRIEGVLGQGAVAVVYRAQSRNGQTVALKVLYRTAANQRSIRQLFQLEYKLTARLRHPGIVRTVDAGEADGFYYMAMELVEGKTLEEFLAPDKRLGEDTAIRITRQMADALDYLHERHIVHRDVKPSNILIGRTGRALLFDFGAALDLHDPTVTEQGGVYGTPAFVAPEQIRNSEEVDGRADLYALGIVLYRLVSGRKPFYGSRDEVLDAHLHDEPPPPSNFAYVSPELESVILRAIAKEPADRFQSGSEFVAALDSVELTPEPVRPALTQRVARWLRRAPHVE